MLIAGAILCIAAAITFTDWRRGLFAAVPIAMLQDPLRKMVEGQPVVYVMLVGAVIGIAALAATISGVSLMPNRIHGWRQRLAFPFALLIAVLILQGVNGFARFGTPIVPLIGLMSYLVPFAAICLVYQIVVRSPENVLSKFMWFYVACVCLVLPTIALEYMGYDWAVLGEVGVGITIFDQGTAMDAYSGLFRASEIAAWHAGAAACFLIILLVSKRLTLSATVLGVLSVLIIISLGVLTGRRKFLVEIFVFGFAYLTLLMYFGRGGARLAIISGLIGVAGFLGLTMFLPEEKREIRAFNAPYELYLERSKTVFGDVPERFRTLGLAPITWAYNKYGLFGAGLGAGSQGAGQFGATGEHASEGGLGKIWLELGAPGFLVIAWFGWALVRHLWSIVHVVNRQSLRLSRMALGLMSFLIANVANFSVATQAYGDVMVLLLVGTALGALLAMPVVADRAIRKRIVGLTQGSNAVLLPRPA
jgi:hypothetical protein